ncbi:uncharacterized protein HMPREF1541_03187 [Cyphellophora europaea CBS 101466]|uniref:SMP-30/Gluconolactonase/LRE-like region domain-containing protein n=1 Tax=Cyphellophora europaea (strain CBS 101466) TaxID=1220924 RepID=W2RXS9_CYPE1|nr:uncharacterized protein HMPREF1541_03187 [Cyphellophora europaea CBS 101466]ETN41252.1 hypothetical protein HMPREF1541_03187 [Cyphellophora europaea CBS 101466]
MTILAPAPPAANGASSFYISNDHYFYPGFLFGIPRKLEDLLGPFRWETGIVYCDASDAKIQCKEVSPNGHHPHANGILLADDGKTLMVNDVIDGSTTIYDIDSSSKLLTVRKKVKLGAAADNLSFIPGTGDIAVCVFPHIGHLIHKLSGENVLNSSVTASAAVLRLVKSKEYEPEVLFWDDGSQISGLTGAAVDPKRKKLIAGGVYEQHFVVCDLGNEQF